MSQTILQKKDFFPFYSMKHQQELFQFLLDWLPSAQCLLP